MRYIHISARLATTMVNGNPQTYVVRQGTTFNAGRNAEKRKARHREKLIREADLYVHGSMPKRSKSQLTIDMLSDRRLRQRDGEGYATRTAEAA